MRHSDRIAALLENGRVMRHSELVQAGIPPFAISRALARELICRRETDEGVSAGYSLSSCIPEKAPEGLDSVMFRHPKAVFCLQSALRFWNLTDRTADRLTAAVRKGENRMSAGNVKLIEWSDPLMFEVGVTSHSFAGRTMQITDIHRTVADMFRPEHQQDPGDAAEALALLLSKEGAEGMRKVSEAAQRLGWHRSVSTAIVAMKEAVKWNPGGRNP